MMRRPAALIVLCASLVFATQALAAELPQRWVSAGGALSEWISALGSGNWWGRYHQSAP